MAASDAIPTVDLSPFFTIGDDEGQEKAREIISQACSEYGFFQLVNHGVPVDLMNRAMVLSKTFFEYSDEEKLKVSSGPGAPVPAGYNVNKQPDHSAGKEEYSVTFPPEYLLMFPPGSTFNVFPSNPPDYREVLEELFTNLTKTCQLVETILSDCLGLPRNVLKEFNDDRSWDLLAAFHYFQATETEDTGVSQHQDVNCITFVLQDEVGGLEVEKNGIWIPVIPTKGTIVVNVSDVFQVLSNNRFKSAIHRVVRSKERSRHSYAFFYNLQGDKWVEPLPELTTAIGEAPKYRGFWYKDYQALRTGNKTVSRAEDVITISHYSIPT